MGARPAIVGPVGDGNPVPLRTIVRKGAAMTKPGLLSHLWQTQRIAVILLLISALALGVFAVRFVRVTVYFNDPRHIQEPLEPWMTPRYVGRSYDLPPEAARKLFRLDTGAEGRPTMGRIARDMGLTLQELQALVRAEADKARKAQP